MKRTVALLGLMVLPVLGFTPAADAVGYGACTISGTMTFSSSEASPGSSQALDSGQWRIPHAIINCQGVIGLAEERMVGPGPFKGSGSFTTVPPGTGGCLQQQGTGSVEYEIQLTGGTLKVSEPVSHTLAGAGVLNTPTLHGLFQLPPPYDGDCVTAPVGETTFVAQVVLYRYPREVPVPLAGV